MKNAISALLSDHKMIRKLLEAYRLDNPRYDEIAHTLDRVVRMHAWFEDTVFLPAFEKEPLLVKRYLDELYQEHKDIDALSTLVRQTKREETERLESYTRQFRAILTNHLAKEEDALFPLAEKVLSNEGLIHLGAEMERRQAEAQKLFNP